MLLVIGLKVFPPNHQQKESTKCELENSDQALNAFFVAMSFFAYNFNTNEPKPVNLFVNKNIFE